MSCVVVVDVCVRFGFCVRWFLAFFDLAVLIVVWCDILLGASLRGLLFFSIQNAYLIRYDSRITYVVLSISILVQDCFSGSFLS